MSGQQQKRGKQDKGSERVEKVLVAVKSSKEIPKNALIWALSHVVQPGDCITLLVVVPPPSSGRKLWGFPRFAGDCASSHKKCQATKSVEQKIEITDSCSQMILQLHDVYDPNKINVKIKVVSASPAGAVAAEAKKIQANWVVLDKELRHEEKHCMDELHCNIVAMKRSQAKVLRLNLVGSHSKEFQLPGPSGSGTDEASAGQLKNSDDLIRGPVVTPSSSPELFTATEAGTSSVSSSDPGTSPFTALEITRGLKKDALVITKESRDLAYESESDDDDDTSPCSTSSGFRPWIGDEYMISNLRSSRKLEMRSQRVTDMLENSPAMALLEKLSLLERDSVFGSGRLRPVIDFAGNVREAMSLSRSAPPGPPPLCSICQHKAPVFGKPPRWFSYAELELATCGFSQNNFLAEGGRNQAPLEWYARHKIAVGAARGLRYLHEECRVGCIVHRDMRPNNILLTHDYEPLVGDFGLARWQPDGDTGVETRVIGTFGYIPTHNLFNFLAFTCCDLQFNRISICDRYLAPEYAQSGQITEKADVYSFGVVLVELLTGRKAVDLTRPKGQQCLTEWARPLLEGSAIKELIDPRLGNRYSEQEVYWLMHAASLCIRRDPHSRPRMSQVLRVLEGDMFMDSSALCTPRHDGGNRSGRFEQQQQKVRNGPLYEASEGYMGNFSCESSRTSLWGREKARTSDRGL
ncbi:hypothetical protein Cgig2_028713 [Carnegiea gigantea]|uniref:Protein kinase domain-containing protein n=1 Tax=Carnegiea gigantea TaxID=171969 RepID=A0A9Q1KBT1_9CARY|nr:hypothetical protein Cgig2_028713 [Carnegiea gigantea]